MKKCQNCNHDNPEINNYCGICGNRLLESEPYAFLIDLKVPKKIQAKDYENPKDRKYINSLSQKSTIVKALKEFNKNWDSSEIKKSLLGNSVKVNNNQFPEIHNLNLACSEIADLEPPEVFITQNPSLNAFTVGIKPYYVVFTSSLIDVLDEQELSFVLGHEIGHIKSGHVKYLQLAHNWLDIVSKTSTVASQVGYFVNMWVGMGLSWLSQHQMNEMLQEIRSWQREGEVTADRLGLIICQNEEKAATALIKLALGSGELAKRINIDEYLNQYEELSKNIDLSALDEEGEQTHPYTARRVKNLLKWGKSKKYKTIFREENIEHKQLCPACDQQVARDSKKCLYCGVEFYECEHCQSLVLPDADKCLICGVEFE